VTDTSSGPSSGRPVDAVADRYVEEYAALDPITATYIGVDGHDAELTDLSPEGFGAREELTRRALADATAATPVDEREEVARDAFLERLGLEVELAEAGLARGQVSVISSDIHAIRQVFDLMPTDSEHDWANIASRLAAIPRTLDGLRATLLDEAGKGNVVAVRQYRAVVDQIGSWTGRTGEGGDMLGSLVARCGIEAMAATSGRILPGASYVEAVAHLEADESRKVHGRDAFRGWMQELADRTIEELAGVHFDIPEPVRRIECMLAPTNDGGIYYTGPSEDFSRPGRMWWSVPDGIDDFSPWREVTTVYHEGVPGHHLQVAQTAYRSELLNRWQRLMCWTSGHGEGWALYAERLMDELGHLDDPADRLGMLDAQSFRAARVIVDIGMHLELEIPSDNPFGFHPGETWDPDLAFEFLRDHCAMEDAFLRFEVDRYLGWPGQAPSYKVGERIWLDARAQAQSRAAAAGRAFDLKSFHRQALDLGALGLEPLQKALARL
jgi:uncharacterized protein (DUF885 family)